MSHNPGFFFDVSIDVDFYDLSEASKKKKKKEKKFFINTLKTFEGLGLYKLTPGDHRHPWFMLC